MATPNDAHTPPSSSSAASDSSQPPSPPANDHDERGGCSERRRAETLQQHQADGIESSTISEEQPSSHSLEEMKSDPTADVDVSSLSSPTVDDAAAGIAIVHIDERTRRDDARPPQTESDEESIESSTSSIIDVTPLTGALAAGASISSLPSAEEASWSSRLLTSGGVGRIRRGDGFDVSHDDAAPDGRELLSQLIACAWSQLGPTSTRRNMTSLNPPILIGRIDTFLESMADRCNRSYPSKCHSLISEPQRPILHEAFKIILASFNWNRADMVGQAFRLHRMLMVMDMRDSPMAHSRLLLRCLLLS
jgi:hypothetical protein